MGEKQEVNFEDLIQEPKDLKSLLDSIHMARGAYNAESIKTSKYFQVADALNSVGKEGHGEAFTVALKDLETSMVHVQGLIEAELDLIDKVRSLPGMITNEKQRIERQYGLDSRREFLLAKLEESRKRIARFRESVVDAEI